jgi:hypothetical protein
MHSLVTTLQSLGILVGAYGLGYPFERFCYYTMVLPYAKLMDLSVGWNEYNRADKARIASEKARLK